MISFSLVDVASIKSDVPRSKFSESTLDTLADLLLATGGLIKPILLKQGIGQYSVLGGHLEYYVAVRAKEKDLAAGEMVQAFIVSPEVEDLAIKQSEEFQKLGISADPLNPDLKEVLSRLSSLEIRVEKRFNEVDSRQHQDRREIEAKIQNFEKEKAEKVDLLEMLNTFSEGQLSAHFQRNRISNYKKLVATISTARGKKQDQRFDSYADVESIKGLGSKTLAVLLDSCR